MLFFLLIYSLLFLNVSPTNYQYVNETSRFCFDANICGHELAAVSDGRSCCQDCSCDQSCWHDENCCFSTSNKTSYKECILPSTKQILLSERYKHIFYRMVSRCPIDPADFKTRQTPNGQDCGEKKVAPWGSLMPVYSEITGTLFKNSECAKCHGIDKFSFWKINLDCKTVTPDFTSEYSVTSYLQWLTRNSTKPDYCEVRFASPLSYTLVKQHECHISVIDTCNYMYTLEAVRMELNMTNSEIEQACYHGPRAAIHINGPYPFGNVFCYLCNGGTLNKVDNCRRYSYLPIQQTFPRAFTAIIDPYILYRLQQEDNARQRVACKTADGANKINCVPVNCPIGKLYDRNYQCINPTKTWKSSKYVVTVHLKPVAEINVSYVLSLNDAFKRGDQSWLVMPWPSMWKLISLYFRLHIDHPQQVSEFVAVVSLTKNINHEKILNIVRTSINKRWRLNLVDGNVTVALKARFSKYKVKFAFLQSYSFVFIPSWVWGAAKKKEEILNVAQNYTFYSVIASFDFPVQGEITKLHFCPLITLRRNMPFQLEFSEKLLRFNNRTFFDNEFEIVRGETASTHVKICVQDSPYVMLTSSDRSIGFSLGLLVLPFVLHI